MGRKWVRIILQIIFSGQNFNFSMWSKIHLDWKILQMIPHISILSNNWRRNFHNGDKLQMTLGMGARKILGFVLVSDRSFNLNANLECIFSLKNFLSVGKSRCQQKTRASIGNFYPITLSMQYFTQKNWTKWKSKYYCLVIY